MLLPDALPHVHTATGWKPLQGATQNLDGVGIGTGSDSVNRLAVAADASLFSHAGAGHQVKLNKATAGDTASLLYQSGWSGRAEIGLAGNDDLSVKVSADGSAWVTALAIDGASGALGLTPGTAPADPQPGHLYFDAATSKLRCHDGSLWHDLF